MTKQKLLAPLTVLFCSITSISSLSIFAETASDYPEIVKRPDDGSMARIVYDGMYYGVMVETNGTELTEDMVSHIEGFQYVDTWEAFTKTYPWGVSIVDASPDGDAYMIRISTTDADRLATIGRNLTMELDCIEEVHLVNYTEYQRASIYWDFYVTPLSQDIQLDANSIPELKEFAVTGSSETCYHYSYPEDLYGEFYQTLMQQVDVEGWWDYDLYEYFSNYARQIEENHSDKVASVKLRCTFLESENETLGTSTSVWLTAGDPNSDGAVDAADAADVLQTAADNGAAAADAQTPATPATDVNADGTVDAADAAAILQYAAAEGAGLETDWVEILK